MSPSSHERDVLLAAAHRFLRGDRLATELNVLAIVGLTGLESTAKTPVELRSYIKNHTGVKPDLAIVDNAIEVLLRAGLAEQATGGRWTATSVGREQVEQSLEWAAASRAELEKDVACAAEDHGLCDALVRAPSLTNVLVKVLEDGLFTAIVAQGLGVEKVGDHLVPRSLDLRGIVQHGAALLPTDPDAHRVVADLLRRALSPADPFASVQVTDLVTAALMNMVVGHHDEADLRRALGTLSGVVVVVDTPIALSLLAEPNVVENTERVLTQALECGVDLRFGPSLANEIETSVRYVGDTTLRDRVDDRLIIDEIERVVDLIDGDGILSSYVRGRYSGRFEDWHAFEHAASRLTARLRQIGVKSIEFPADDAPDVRTFLAAHNETIVRRGVKDPGTPAARADARLMAYLQGARRKTSEGVWPAAWLLSPDTHVPDTYRFVTNDNEPATVTLGQLGGLLLRFADSAEQLGLARAASGSLRRDALFATAARMPAPVVDRLVEIASSPEISIKDRRRIHRGVAGVLEYAERETDIEAAVAKVTNDVLVGTNSRVRRRYEEMSTTADARAVAADREARQARRDAEKADRDRQLAVEGELEAQRVASEIRAGAQSARVAAEDRAGKDAALRKRDRVLLLASFVIVFAAYRTSHWSIVGIGGAGVWQAWVAWEEQIESGSPRPRWSALGLLVLSAAADVVGLFGL